VAAAVAAVLLKKSERAEAVTPAAGAVSAWKMAGRGSRNGALWGI
jgi:hypothetical protein